MKKDESRYMLKEIFEKTKIEFPAIMWEEYRDGGSVAFSIPTDGYNNIVLMAPVTRVYSKPYNSISEARIDHVEILKEGCIKFEDSYKMENIEYSVSIEGRPENGSFDKEKKSMEIYGVLKNALSKRIKK